jgi:hypothetical protein
MGVGDVKNYQKLRDVIYGRPLWKKLIFSRSLLNFNSLLDLQLETPVFIDTKSFF